MPNDPSALAMRLGHAVFELMMRAAMEQQVNVLMLPSSQDFAALLDRAGLAELVYERDDIAGSFKEVCAERDALQRRLDAVIAEGENWYDGSAHAMNDCVVCMLRLARGEK